MKLANLLVLACLGCALFGAGVVFLGGDDSATPRVERSEGAPASGVDPGDFVEMMRRLDALESGGDAGRVENTTPSLRDASPGGVAAPGLRAAETPASRGADQAALDALLGRDLGGGDVSREDLEGLLRAYRELPGGEAGGLDSFDVDSLLEQLGER